MKITKKMLAGLGFVVLILMIGAYRQGRAEAIHSYQKGSIRFGYTYFDRQSSLPYSRVIVTPRGKSYPPITLMEERPKHNPPPIVETYNYSTPVRISPSCPDIQPEGVGKSQDLVLPPKPQLKPKRITI